MSKGSFYSSALFLVIRGRSFLLCEVVWIIFLILEVVVSQGGKGRVAGPTKQRCRKRVLSKTPTYQIFLPPTTTSLKPCPSRVAMSVRVVARVRPLLRSELDKDSIVSTCSSGEDEGAERANVIKIPNPKNEGEWFSFQFHSVYDECATQQEVFDNEGTRRFANCSGCR